MKVFQDKREKLAFLKFPKERFSETLMMTLPIIKKFLPSLQEKPWFVTLTEDYILSLP